MPVKTVFDRVETGPGWEVLAKDERNSTVSYFVIGWKYVPDGTEVLIWRGVTRMYAVDDDGEVVTDNQRLVEGFSPEYIEEGYELEGVEGTEIGDGKSHIVEYVPGEDTGIETVPVEGLDEAVEVANEFINGSREEEEEQ